MEWCGGADRRPTAGGNGGCVPAEAALAGGALATGFHDLPLEVAGRVFELLDPLDVKMARLVSRCAPGHPPCAGLTDQWKGTLGPVPLNARWNMTHGSNPCSRMFPCFLSYIFSSCLLLLCVSHQVSLSFDLAEVTFG